MGPWANQSHTDRGNVIKCDQQQLSEKTMTMYNEIHINSIFLSPVTQQLLVSSWSNLSFGHKRGHTYVTAGPSVEPLLILKCKNCNSLWNVHDIKQMNLTAHLLLFKEYPANINSSILTQSDHNNFNIRTAATFYDASTTVKNCRGLPVHISLVVDHMALGQIYLQVQACLVLCQGYCPQ